MKFIGLRLRYTSEALKSQSSRLSSNGMVKANIALFADEVRNTFMALVQMRPVYYKRLQQLIYCFHGPIGMTGGRRLWLRNTNMRRS